MARRPDPARKREILERVAEYVLTNGWADGSLRRVGRAVGTSARMLIYHFGSSHQLLIAAIAEIGARHRAELDNHLNGRDGRQRISAPKLWKMISAPERERYHRFLYWVLGQAVLEPERFAPLLDLLRDEYGFNEESMRAAGIPDGEARSRATLATAVARGLMIESLMSGERERCNEAVVVFARDLDGAIASNGAKAGGKKPVKKRR